MSEPAMTGTIQQMLAEIVRLRQEIEYLKSKVPFSQLPYMEAEKQPPPPSSSRRRLLKGLALGLLAAGALNYGRGQEARARSVAGNSHYGISAAPTGVNPFQPAEGLYGLIGATGSFAFPAFYSFTAGVLGTSNSSGQSGVVGFSNGSGGQGVTAYALNSGTALYAESGGMSSFGARILANGANSTGLQVSGQKIALQLNGGAFSVGGAYFNSDGPVFIHQTTASNVIGDRTIIDNPITNNRPNAILFVTYNIYPPNAPVTSARSSKEVGVYYDGTKWSIFNLDQTPMQANLYYNVMVVIGS